MKILLMGNYKYDKQQSMQRFANILKNELLILGHEVKMIRPEPFFGALIPSYKGMGKWLGYIDKFILFPCKLHKEIQWADIVHICDHSNAFYVKYFKTMPHLVTCNDLLAMRSALNEFRENKTYWTGRMLQHLILQGLNKSKYVSCISEATMKDLLRFSRLEKRNISVVYMGLNYPYTPMEKEKANKYLKCLRINTNIPFILHVGKNSWYKNRLGVIDIFNYLIKFEVAKNFVLVLVGDVLTKEMKQFILRNNIDGKISILPYVENEDLCALYSTAQALLYPSIAEGFGWPIIEAQACGCPVFTSNRAPMTEVGGDAAVYFDPENPLEAARIIANNLEKHSQMRAAGFLNIKRFSTEDMIKNYIGIYEKLLRSFG